MLCSIKLNEFFSSYMEKVHWSLLLWWSNFSLWFVIGTWGRLSMDVVNVGSFSWKVLARPRTHGKQMGEKYSGQVSESFCALRYRRKSQVCSYSLLVCWLNQRVCVCFLFRRCISLGFQPPEVWIWTEKKHFGYLWSTWHVLGWFKFHGRNECCL